MKNLSVAGIPASVALNEASRMYTYELYVPLFPFGLYVLRFIIKVARPKTLTIQNKIFSFCCSCQKRALESNLIEVPVNLDPSYREGGKRLKCDGAQVNTIYAAPWARINYFGDDRFSLDYR